MIANIGDSSTGLALRHARHAVEAGADALALTPPHYYPHSMDEMLIHYRALKEAFPDLPLLIYNIPQTVKVKMTVPTTLQLAREGTVQGIKDSQNDLRWFRVLTQAITPMASKTSSGCSSARASSSTPRLLLAPMAPSRQRRTSHQPRLPSRGKPRCRAILPWHAARKKSSCASRISPTSRAAGRPKPPALRR